MQDTGLPVNPSAAPEGNPRNWTVGRAKQTRTWYVRVNDDRICTFPNRLNARVFIFEQRAQGHRVALYYMKRQFTYPAIQSPAIHQEDTAGAQGGQS